MQRVKVALLRGVCQMPAYVAHELDFFAEQEIEALITIQPTAWVVPQQLMAGTVDFAVLPWTRVAAACGRGEDLVAICGSGCEEAALVVRSGIDPQDVQTLAVPQEGGIKDLTAAALVQSLNWTPQTTLRLPSGDGAILALVGQAADAASMVEPYATMVVELGIGRVVQRTGDVWPGAPGCSLTTARRLLQSDPDLVQRFVTAFRRGADVVNSDPAQAAAISSPYIGVHERFVHTAAQINPPNVKALYNESAINDILALMTELGYLQRPPKCFLDLRFLK